MRELKFEQHTPEWHAVRASMPTASEVKRIVTTKGEVSKQRQAYMYSLAARSVSGVTIEGYQSKSMEEGIRREAEARRVYAMFRETPVQEVGFCIRDIESADGQEIIAQAGCSPDGLVGEDGGLELKNPEDGTHAGYLLSNRLPTQYFIQVQTSLWVTERQWWDFVSHYPGLPLFVVRVYPDEKFHAVLDVEIPRFCAELEEVRQQLQATQGQLAVEVGAAVEGADGKLSFGPK